MELIRPPGATASCYLVTNHQPPPVHEYTRRQPPLPHRDLSQSKGAITHQPRPFSLKTAPVSLSVCLSVCPCSLRRLLDLDLASRYPSNLSFKASQQQFPRLSFLGAAFRYTIRFADYLRDLTRDRGAKVDRRFLFLVGCTSGHDVHTTASP